MDFKSMLAIARPGALSRSIRRMACLHAGVLAAAIALSACAPPDTSQQVTGLVYDRETEVFELIDRLDFGAIGRAYADLEGTRYVVRTTTRQLDRDGNSVATERTTVRHGPDAVAVEDVTSEGTMSTGFMTFAVSDDSVPDLSRSVAELWTPNEPAFTSSRNRDYYRYTRARDTVVAGEPCITYSVTVLERISADRMPIRAARLYVSEADSSIRGLRIDRQDDAIFYHERSSLQMTLARGSDQRLRPLRRQVAVEVKAPLRSTHSFVTAQEYVIDDASRIGGD